MYYYYYVFHRQHDGDDMTAGRIIIILTHAISNIIIYTNYYKRIRHFLPYIVSI